MSMTQLTGGKTNKRHSDFQVKANQGALYVPDVRRIHPVLLMAWCVWTFAALFLLSGLVGVWASYDGRAAALVYTGIVLGIAPLYLLPLIVMGENEPRILGALGVIASLLLLLIGTLSLWCGIPALTALSPLDCRSISLVPSANEAGGLSAMLLPPVIATLFIGWSERRFGQMFLMAFSIGVGSAALLLSSSRGAMIGLAAGVFVALYLWGRFAKYPANLIWRVLDLFLILGICTLLAIYVSAILFPNLDGGVGALLFGDSANSRLGLWRDSIPVMQDYWLTGSGLGVTPMILSTYAILVHVPFLLHAHNLYIQIVIEQGLPGLVAFVGIFGGVLIGAIACWRLVSREARMMLAGWVAAIVAMLVHGLFDAELYASPYRALLLASASAPFLLIWLSRHEMMAYTRARRMSAFFGITLALLLVLLPLSLNFWSPWQANLGAVLETKAQLAAYVDDKWMIQDSVLRVETPELANAEEWLVRALESSPTNATANRRLGQIAFARDDYDAAFDYFQAALADPFASRTTLQYLGELYALRGEPEQAALIWRMLDMGQGQLDARSWWYQYEVVDPEQTERFNAAVARLMELE